MCVFIVYPERRFVSEDQIASWYADAVANDECDSGMDTIDSMASALDDAGIITRGRAPASREGV